MLDRFWRLWTMGKNQIIEEKLTKKKISVGDHIEIRQDGDVKQGVLMPHHAFSDDDILTIKLENGYNIGVEITEETKVKRIKKGKKAKAEPREIPHDPEKPTISIIGTGGTIACYVDYRTGAVHPATSAEELVFSVPEILDVCNVKARVAFQTLSENIDVSHWKKLAEEVAKELNEEGVNGVVIPHGTDTLGYTAAALSFMLKDLSGPVVLVGAQRSSDRPSSDAAQNLLAAAQVAANTDLGEVVAVMHGESSDSYSTIHRGTKVRKFHTSRRDAFKTINQPRLGTVENGNIDLTAEYQPKSANKTKVDNKMEEDVGLIYFYPGMKPEEIPPQKGIVLMGTGLGHVSNDLISRVKQLIDEGSTVVMTSQCIFGRVNMKVYSTGRDLLKAGVIPGEDMLPETAYVKLMWTLAHAKEKEEIKEMMSSNLAGEITPRTRSDTF